MKGSGVLQKAFYKSLAFLKRQAPTILTCLSGAGVIATSVLAVKATPKAVERLKEATEEKGEELTLIETIYTAGPVYISASATLLGTLICLFGANGLSKRQQASLLGAYALLEKSYQQYRKTVTDIYGEDAEARIHAEMAQDVYISEDGYSLYDPETDKESDTVLFFDSYSQRWFTATLSAVINAEYHINRMLQIRGNTCINEFYTFLGIDEVSGGSEIGWSLGTLLDWGLSWLDFENRFIQMEGGMECYLISALIEPELFDYER
ncbi:MAG: DUF6353 family protein [Clostridia bacterium]